MLDERQRAFLREMGVPVWQPAPPAVASVPVDAAALPLTPLAPRSAAASAPLAAPVPTVRRVADMAAASPVEAAPSQETPALPPSAIATLEWPALREAVAACRACALCQSRKQTVFGVGHSRAHWMVVGEAPGEQEDLRGEPFVGPSGQLLDSMLRSLGLTRAEAAVEGRPPLLPQQQVYIANSVKCRPPRNRNPEPQELQKCEPFLQRQIDLVQPRVILAMGRFAVQSLLRTNEPIGKLRGRVHQYQNVPTIVTYHPAYLLRNLLDKARAWEDLCLAVQTVQALPARAD